MEPMHILLGYFACLVVMSVITFVVFAWDKRRARRQGWRVSEKTLHTLELLGGWPGAWLAMRWLRHKSIKPTYRRVFWLIVTTHATAIGVFIWVALRR